MKERCLTVEPKDLPLKVNLKLPKETKQYVLRRSKADKLLLNKKEGN